MAGQNLIDMGAEQVCDLHSHELELLKQSLSEKQSQMIAMETQSLREAAELEDSIVAWQDKYERLYESHKRVQKVNQSLEDNLLTLADKNTAERDQWTSDVAKLSVSLADTNYLVSNLRREIERYKKDMNLAIQLLRCNTEHFSTPKISSLPKDMQTKLTALSRLDSDSENLAGGGGATDRRSSANYSDTHSNVMYRVLPASESPPPGVCPFPPTAMVHSMRGVDAKTDLNEITPELMAKYLEEEVLAADRMTLKSTQPHCSTCRCQEEATVATPAFHQSTYSIGTQTAVPGAAYNSLCLRCNSNLNSPSRSSPYIMKLGGSSVHEEKAKAEPRRNDELQVNPILGHHRLSAMDRTSSVITNGGGVGGARDITSDTVTSPIIGGPLLAKNNQTIPDTKNDPAQSTISGANSPYSGGLPEVVNTSSFNNVLIKNIKMSEHMSKSLNRPRLCSIRISSEGAAAATRNILLENADRLNCDTVSIVSHGGGVCGDHLNHLSNTQNVANNVEQLVYKKRSKYLDEELNDSREVIVCMDKRPPPIEERPPDSPGRPSSAALIELNNHNNNNKTDSEKYRETHSSTAAAEQKEPQKPLRIEGAGETLNDDQSVFLMDDPVPVVESLQVMDMTKRTATTTTAATVVEPTNNLKNNNNLRQEQLDRVAVWVQQSNEQQQQQHRKSSEPNSHLSSLNKKCNHSALSGSNVSQLTTSPVSYSADDVCINIGIEGEEEEEEQPTQQPKQEEVATAPEANNIAQMEYNVKQFLLKQNEWSIGRGSATVPGQVKLASSTGNIYSPSASSMSFTSSSLANSHNNKNLRTETNL